MGEKKRQGKKLRGERTLEEGDLSNRFRLISLKVLLERGGVTN